MPPVRPGQLVVALAIGAATLGLAARVAAEKRHSPRDPPLELGAATDARTTLDELLNGYQAEKNDAGPSSPDDGNLPAQFSCDFRIMDGIAAHTPEIRKCIEAARRADAGQFDQSLKIHWVIEPDGHTSQVRAKDPAKDQTAFAACMVKLIRTIRFDPRPGKPVEVDLPFKY